MRNGQNKHRMRGRNRGGGGKSHNPLTRVYESNGPDVKIRGTANHIAEKYIQLARDATASGDPVAAENYYQHAEHYFRLIAAAQEQFRQSQPFQPQRESSEESFDGDDDSQPNFEPHAVREQPYQQQHQPREAQPYQPREQREQREQPYQRDYQPRHERQPREDRQPRHERNPYQENRQPQQANGAQDDDVERLPSFITGGPAQNAPQASGDQEQQTDRFPLHRRRRRGPRGPRPDMAEGGDDTQGQAPAGE